MGWKLVGEIMIAALAVFGMYCLLRLSAGAVFRSDNILVAIEVNTEEELRRLDLTIEEARRELFSPHGRVVILLDASFAERDGLLDALEQRDVDCYVFDLDE